MIGRAAIANPWIFSGLDRDQVSPEQVREIVRQHLERNVKFYGEEDGQRLFRKHAVQYLLLRDAFPRRPQTNLTAGRQPSSWPVEQIYACRG